MMTTLVTLCEHRGGRIKDFILFFFSFPHDIKKPVKLSVCCFAIKIIALIANNYFNSRTAAFLNLGELSNLMRKNRRYPSNNVVKNAMEVISKQLT